MKTLGQLIDSLVRKACNIKDGRRLVLDTDAPFSYIPDILDRIKFSVEGGGTYDKGTIIGFDETIYTYEFYYKE